MLGLMSTNSRRGELDALRGLLLVVMTAEHLPTGLSAYANQPLGFVSAAEGFVFLSAFLVGTIYARQLLEKGLAHVRSRLWGRAGKLYLVHLALIAFAFTVVAGIAVLSGRQTLHNHLAFLFQSPLWAGIASPLLMYEPPLLDILPMYVVFLALSPLVLHSAARRGWAPVLTASGALWGFAQLGGRRWLYTHFAAATGFPVPLEALGSFDWLAWQLVWVGGLWLGAGTLRRRRAAQTGLGSAPPSMPRGLPALPVLIGALLLATLFLVGRHRFAGAEFDTPLGAALLGKWHLGALRVLDFAALAVIARHLLLPALALMRIPGLALLGRSSLAVFTTHLPFCFLSRGLIANGAPGLAPWQQIAVLALTFGAMLGVAWWADEGRRASPRALAAPT